MARLLSYQSLVLGSMLLAIGCQRPEGVAAKARPSWVTQVDLIPMGTKPAFEGNVELLVTIKNKTQSPVVLDHLDRGDEVQLAGARGARVALHPLSVGVAKPIVLGPGAVVQSSLLFKRLDEPAQRLEVYGLKSSVRDQASQR